MITLQNNIKIDQGSTYRDDIWFLDSNDVPIDVSSYTAVMQIRADYNDDAELIVDANTANGMMIFHEGGDAGKLTVLIPSAVSSAITVNGSVRQAVYNIEITSATGEVTRIYSGHCDIRKDINL